MDFKTSIKSCVAGASAGIGEAAAWRFAELGCKLILAARRTDKLESLKLELVEKYNASVFLVTLNVRSVEDIKALPGLLPTEFQNVR